MAAAHAMLRCRYAFSPADLLFFATWQLADATPLPGAIAAIDAIFA